MKRQLGINFLAWIAILVGTSLAWCEEGSADGAPRKIVVGTAVYPFYSFPGQDQRLRDIEGLIDDMASQAEEKYGKAGLDLVVLPEEVLNLGGGRSPRERAVDLDGPEMKRMRNKARQYQTYVVAPVTLLESESPEVCTNSAVLLDRQGETVGIYRKVHPVAGFDTEVLEGGITPGRDFPVFQCDFGKVGVQICWDLSFGDGWRALADRGAEIVVVPSASPQTVRPSMYALQGGYHVVTATPRNNASVFNPLGRISAQIREPGVLVHQLDLEHVLLHWSSSLSNGRAFTRKYGDRAGFLYYEDEDAGMFWSNDANLPIRHMVSELEQLELAEHIERTRKLQERRRPKDDSLFIQP